MPTWIICLMLGIGTAAWSYAKLAHMNGNANPTANLWLAVAAGGVVFFIVFSLLKLVLGF